MEKIRQISKFTHAEMELHGDHRTYEGYLIMTDKQDIKLLIENGQNCCETWGYFVSQDDTADFIGADLLKIELVDEALNVRDEIINGEDCSVMFVNIHTSKGLLQFVAYNAHNGYYGHTAKVISTQLTHETTL